MTASLQLSVPIIGYVRSPLSQKFGIPRQPNLVNVTCTLEFIAPYHNPQAFEGLVAFSHIWVIWQFHQNRAPNPQLKEFRPQVRPPRLGGNQRVGVFATRSMYRPSELGLSVVKLHAVNIDKDKVVLTVQGADMVDGTPIVDIKPYMVYSDSIEDAKSGFAEDIPPTKQVHWNKSALTEVKRLVEQNSLSDEDMTIITALIAQDPRPAYRQHETYTKFVMRYKTVDVGFEMDENHELWVNHLLKLEC